MRRVPGERQAERPAGRTGHHQRPVAQAIDDIPEEVDRRRIRPLQILDDQEERLLPQPPLDEGSPGEGDLALQLLGLDLRLLRIVEAEKKLSTGETTIGARRPARPCSRSPAASFCARDLDLVAGTDLIALPQEEAPKVP